MTIPMAQFKNFDAPGACFHSIADRVRAGAGESGLAILFHALYSALNRGAEKASRAR